MATMQLGCEAETEFGHTLCVCSDSHSHAGQTLVTLGADEMARLVLFPAEARDLARVLLRAADVAEGV